jgi:hypothetical protein
MGHREGGEGAATGAPGVLADNVPDSLKCLDQWVLWKNVDDISVKGDSAIIDGILTNLEAAGTHD